MPIRGAPQPYLEFQRSAMGAPALSGILLHVGRDVDADERIISHDPGVMPRRDAGEITRFQIHLTAVVLDDPQPAADDVLEVLYLTTVGVDHGPNALGPFPARLKGELCQSRVFQGHKIQLSVTALPGYIRRVETSSWRTSRFPLACFSPFALPLELSRGNGVKERPDARP